MDNKKKEKSEGEKLAEKLLSDKKNGGLRLSEEKIKKADKFCEGYKSFLNTAKTEREAVIEAVAQAEKAGFKPYEKGKKYDAGDKFYFVNRGKAIILTVMGKDGLEKGIRLAAAHIDSPRLDLKQNPLYEDKELCLFKTHYYGGIKKYQWAADTFRQDITGAARTGTANACHGQRNDHFPGQPCFGCAYWARTIGHNSLCRRKGHRRKEAPQAQTVCKAEGDDADEDHSV